MARRRRVRSLFEDVGELLEDRGGGADPDALRGYQDDPVGFIREVLGGEPWGRQVEVAEAVRDAPLVAVPSANGTGKDWLAARLCLWWCYARGGLAVVTGPTRQQVEEIMMRKEVAAAFRRARDLPGELHVRALRPGGSGRAGIVAKTASEVSGLTGLHEAEVLVCISEAQAEGLGVAFQAAFANAVGERDRILAYGQPLNPSGPFHRACRPASQWRTVRIPAADVPNVREDRVVIPGLMTTAGVDRIVREYGEDSGYVRARIHAEFPEQGEEGVFRRDWLEAAASARRWRELDPGAGDVRPVAALDPARHGPDLSCVALRWGPCVPDLCLLRGRTSTTDVVEWAEAVLADARLREDGGRVLVDEVGLGGGVLDRLADRGWPADGYNGGRTPEDEDRHFNARAESYWALRRLLERGRLALPDDERLFEELLAVRWRPTAQGKVQLESKRDMKSRLGRSPDRADSVAMVVAPSGFEHRIRSLTFDETGGGDRAPSRASLRLSRILLKSAYDSQKGNSW